MLNKFIRAGREHVGRFATYLANKACDTAENFSAFVSRNKMAIAFGAAGTVIFGATGYKFEPWAVLPGAVFGATCGVALQQKSAKIFYWGLMASLLACSMGGSINGMLTRHRPPATETSANSDSCSPTELRKAIRSMGAVPANCDYK